MVWRLYPISVLVGGAAASAVGVLLGFLIALGAIAAGFELGSTEDLQRIEVAAVIVIVSIASFLIAGYVTARFAPGEEIVNAAATGAVMVVAGIGSFGDPSMEAFPEALRVLLLVLALPCTWAGAFLYRAR